MHEKVANKRGGEGDYEDNLHKEYGPTLQVVEEEEEEEYEH